MSTVTALIDLLTQNVVVASILVVAAAVIALAKFTDALTKVLAFAKQVWSEWTGRGRKPHPQVERFESLKRTVMHVQVANNLPVELHTLRAFFIEAGLVERPDFSEFYAQWLDQAAVEIGTPALVPGRLSGEHVAQLKSQLERLRL